jgi:pilus assembly protein Flp/PilA
MKAILQKTTQFLKNQDGPTTTEYAVMLALIILVALAAIVGIGEKVESVYTNVNSGLPAEPN